MDATLEEVVRVVRETGGLKELNPDADFYDQGFSSVSALQLLIEVEEQFGVTIPDDAFVKARSARDLAALVSNLKGSGAP
jgi:acyl carrier protein